MAKHLNLTNNNNNQSGSKFNLSEYIDSNKEQKS